MVDSVAMLYDNLFSHLIFFFQMRVLASLRHPNIISLISIFENEHELMLVMERAHGGELFDRIVNRGHFTERDAAVKACFVFDIFMQVTYHIPLSSDGS